MKSSNEKKVALVVFIIILIATVMASTYALYTKTLTATKKYVIIADALRLYLDETKTITDLVEGTNTTPVSDYAGKETEGYYFSLVNEESYPIQYSVYIDENEDNTMPIYALRYNLTETETKLDITGNIEDAGDVGNRVLITQVIPANTTHDYTLKVWLGTQAGNDAKNKLYSASIRVEAEQKASTYYETVLNGTDPVLTNNLIPVLIADDGTVTKANLEEEWYKYEEQRWANAVVLTDNTVTYNDGDIIPESNIESYFVWIPRYRYQIFNRGSYTSMTTINESAVQDINIVFETKNTAVSTGTTKDSWLTHPAFQAFDTNGLWVGKFETGYSGATGKTGAEKNLSDASKVIIKPNVYSWRNITIGNAFKTAYDYMRKEESHMMKNTEWGAVAYLQHSKYGSRQSLRVNNNSNYKTGYAAKNEPTCGTSTTSSSCNTFGTSTSVTYAYNTTNGYLASTTNNITGIYDMSGGSGEYVMGYTTKATYVGGDSELTYMYGDFFTSTEWEKYYDKYTTDVETAFSKRILGDATGEMGPFEDDGSERPISSWYGDEIWMVTDEYPWFYRGSFYLDGTIAGVFASCNHTGYADTMLSFRIVLAP